MNSSTDLIVVTVSSSTGEAVEEPVSVLTTDRMVVTMSSRISLAIVVASGLTDEIGSTVDESIIACGT